MTAAAGAAAIDVTGSLKRLDASCSVEVDVVAAAGAGTYVTGPGERHGARGLDPPGPAISPVTFHAPPRVTLERPSRRPRRRSGLAAAGVVRVHRLGRRAVVHGLERERCVAGHLGRGDVLVLGHGRRQGRADRHEDRELHREGSRDRDTAGPAQPKTGAQLALECSGARIALLEVVQVGNRVRFKGVTRRANAGKQVPIRLLDGTHVVLARVQPNGLFEITGPLPKASIRETEKARYVAELGRDRSPSVKLTRRMTLDALNLSRTSVTIYGQVAKPLPKVKRDIVITQRTSCAQARRSSRRCGRTSPASTARRSAVPRVSTAAIYRLRTRVRVKSGTGKETFRRTRSCAPSTCSEKVAAGAGQRGAPTPITR